MNLFASFSTASQAFSLQFPAHCHFILSIPRALRKLNLKLNNNQFIAYTTSGAESRHLHGGQGSGFWKLGTGFLGSKGSRMLDALELRGWLMGDWVPLKEYLCCYRGDKANGKGICAKHRHPCT